MNGDLVNPTPFSPWCTTVVYPFECSYDEEVECIRGDKGLSRDIFYAVFLVIGLILMSLLVLSLITIIIGTCKGGRVRSLFHQTDMTNHDSWRKKRRLLIIQALIYFIAFLITWVFVAVRMVSLTNGNISSPSAINILQRTFYPLQGFFNAIIFLHHKVTNLRQCHGSSISLSKALYYIILQPKKKMPEMHLSGLSVVKRDRQKQEENKNRISEQKQQQVGNSPDNDNNDSNNSNNSLDDDDRKNDRIPFSEEISYMFDDTGVWVYAESIDENENDEDEIPEDHEDEENIYDTLSPTNLSHDMSFMNASFLAVSHVSEISSIKSKDKEQSDTRNELKGKEEGQEIGDA